MCFLHLDQSDEEMMFRMLLANIVVPAEVTITLLGFISVLIISTG